MTATDRKAAPPPARFGDQALDRELRTLRAEVERLAALPSAAGRVITGVELADGVATPIAHGQGRPLVWVRESCPRGAITTGRVVEVTDSGYDPARYVILKASGFGATITVSVEVR